MKIRPYLSLDIETTGLDTRKSEILSIGMVLDDGVTPFDQLRRKEIFVKLSDYSHQEPEALQMNKYLISRIVRNEVVTHTPREALELIRNEFNHAIDKTQRFDIDNDRRVSKSVTIAGKNVLSFDIPTLFHFFKRHVGPRQGTFLENSHKDNLIAHRAIDIGSLYFSMYGYIPNSEELHTLLGETVAHQALADAEVVVKAVRRSFEGQIKK